MTAGSADPLSASWAELLREKRSLAAIVRDAGRLCVQDSVDVVLDVCDELANAHANGIVHGDLGLHRVRTMWPRRPGDSVEIWALDADDTGAIDFRAAFQAPALAPEQRAGRVGDVRSDIWAVGAILHALIGGAPPMGKRPVREMLPGAPRALVSIVEQCLADDPQARPASVDDVAGALASFASNSPERFQQLARRRIASLKAKHVPAKVTALSRLDELALKRESSGKMLVAQVAQAMPAAQPYGLAPSVIPPAPITQPTTGALRPPTRPSYSDAELPVSALGEPLRKPARSAAFDDASVNEWPMMHGIPSASVAVASPIANADAPTRAGGTLPVADPLPPTLTAVALSDGRIVAANSFNPNETLRMYVAPPSAAFPSAVPTVASPTPPPVEVDPRASGYGFEEMHVEAGARTPAPYIPPAPQAHRPRSYHPPSFGPMAIDVGGDELHFPADARVPSFSDLADYREAKRASRRSATMAVVAAAAVLIVGFSYGARVIKEDRDNMRAAEAAAAAQAPARPPPAVLLPAVAPTPAVSAAPVPAASETPAPATSVSAKAPKTAAPVRKVAPPARKAEPKSDSSKAGEIPKETEFTPGTVFGDAIGKKEPAPANALSDGLK